MQESKINKIGVFDSGLGGLSILNEFLILLPEYDYVYLGDSARTPYGNRSSEIIYKFTLQAVEFLFKNDCNIVILACNTATANALRKIQQEWLPKHYPNKKVLGVIRPTVEVVLEKSYSSENGKPSEYKVGVIATQATVNSKSFLVELTESNPRTHVFQQACPLLVPLIEEGKQDSEEMLSILKDYLQPLQEKEIQSLILGCTHYGHIEDKVRQIMGENVQIVSEGKIVAEKLKDYLERHPEIESNIKKTSKREYYFTDLSQNYQRLVKLFLRSEENIPVQIAKL